MTHHLAFEPMLAPERFVLQLAKYVPYIRNWIFSLFEKCIQKSPIEGSVKKICCFRINVLLIKKPLDEEFVMCEHCNSEYRVESDLIPSLSSDEIDRVIFEYLTERASEFISDATSFFVWIRILALSDQKEVLGSLNSKLI